VQFRQARRASAWVRIRSTALARASGTARISSSTVSDSTGSSRRRAGRSPCARSPTRVRGPWGWLPSERPGGTRPRVTMTGGGKRGVLVVVT
jgi:hypothetical protein